jgi:hypothetical protein
MAPIHELATEEMEQLLLFLARLQHTLAVAVPEVIILAVAPQQEALVALEEVEMEALFRHKCCPLLELLILAEAAVPVLRQYLTPLQVVQE